MPNITLYPRYKLLITYDIQPGKQDAYYRFALGEFVPGLRSMGIHMLSAWHVAWGDYPERQLVFVTESAEVLQAAFASDRWQHLEERLRGFTTDYTRRVVHYAAHFQF